MKISRRQYQPHIVMIGGGHANVLALLRLKRHLSPSKQRCAFKLTLVSENQYTSYSGMLPGYISGYYRSDECFIDLKKLTDRLGIKFIIDRVIGLSDKQLTLSRQCLSYDFLSINTGANTNQLSGTTESAMDSPAIGVKPITSFIDWVKTMDTVSIATVMIVGSGASGVETALALRQRWKKTIRLILVGKNFLTDFNPAFRQRLRTVINEKKIEMIDADFADGGTSTKGRITLSNHQTYKVDYLIFASGVGGPQWLKNTHLKIDNQGFIEVCPTLQTWDNHHIFATGDVASHSPSMPKSGVMAVWQAPILAHNLQVMAEVIDAPLRTWQPKSSALYIIGVGKSRAVASWQQTMFDGRWVWWWKQYLDKRFMYRF